MAGPRFYLFLAALCSCSMIGFGDVTPPKTAPKTELVDVDVLPAATTVEVAGTTPEEHSPKPTTEAEVPTTVEAKNTTTSSTTSTTTTTTTTTTTAPPPPPPPAPTPAPTPKPPSAPTQGTWVYTDTNNVTCIVAQFAAQITLTYSKNVLNVTSLANITMNVPANASIIAGSCNASADEQWFHIGWLSDTTPAAPSTILMLFKKNETTKTYALHTLNLTIDATLLVNSSVKADSIVLSHGEEWSTPLATSYRCAPVTHLSMSNDTYSTSASIAVSGLQEEAFRTTPGKGFSTARDCGSGDVPDAVPIAVGCALGGLVLVVLVAYLAARHRSTARGYLSM